MFFVASSVFHGATLHLAFECFLFGSALALIPQLVYLVAFQISNIFVGVTFDSNSLFHVFITPRCVNVSLSVVKVQGLL